MANLGSLFFELVPTLRGMADTIEREGATEMATAGKRLGSDLGASITSAASSAGADASRSISDSVTSGVRAASRTAGDELRSTITSAARTAGSDAGRSLSEGIGSGAGRANTSVGSLSRALDSLGTNGPRAIQPAVASLGNFTSGFRDSGAAALSMTGRMGTLGGQARVALDSVRTGAASVGEGLSNMATSSERALSRVGSAIRTGVMSPISATRDALAQYGLTAGTALVAAGGAAVTMGIRFDAAREQSVIAFTTMLHSGQAAADMVQSLNNLAASTPFELGQVTTAAQRLLAYGFQARDIVPTLTAIGDAVSGLGGDAGMLDRVTMAIGQMTAKGKIQNDEILQLTEAGIPALRVLANQMGVTTGQLSDMVTKGLVPSSQAVPLLLSGIEQGTRGAAGETQAFAGMMAAQSQTLTGVFSNFKDNANRALGDLVQPAIPAIRASLGVLTSMLGSLPGVMATIGREGAPTFAVLGAAFRDLGRFGADLLPVVRNVWLALQPLAVAAGGVLLAAFREVAALLADRVGPALATVSGWLRPLQPVIVGIATAFAAWYGIGAAVGAVERALGLARLALSGVTLAWRALSLAFVASPIGFIVALLAGLVVGVIYAYNHFQGFRDVVQAAWRGIQAAASAVVSWLQSAFTWLADAAVTVGHAFATGFQALVTAFHAVGDAAVWVWHSILEPAFRGIALAAEVLYLLVATVCIYPFVLLFRDVLAPVALWLWHNVIEPVAHGIGLAFTFLYDYVVKPYFSFIRLEFQTLASAGLWLWHNVIEPVANGIGAAFRWLWDTAISIVGTFIRREIDGWAAIFRWLNDTVVQPVWHAISAAFHWLWDTAVSVVGGFIRREIDGWGAIFHWLYDNVIRPVMDGIGAVLHWTQDNVIGPVMDAGRAAVHWLGQAFEDVSAWVAASWDKVRAAAAVPVNFVISEVYEKGIRATWNWIAEHVGLGNLDLPYIAPIRFAGGGIAPGVDRGTDEVHALLRPGEAVLVPELVQALGAENILAANRAASGGAAGVGAGEMSGGILHAQLGAWISDNILDPLSGAANAAWTTARDVGGAVVDFARDPVGSAQRLLTAIVDDVRGAGEVLGSGDFGQLALGMPRTAVGWLVDHLRNWWTSLTAAGAGPAGAGVAQWQGVILQALSMLGQPASWLATVSRRMMQESGGDQFAVNRWDSNWIAGTPSVGLMQVIGPTYSRFAGPFAGVGPFAYGVSENALANTYSGLAYALSTYGSLDALNRPGGYDAGGLVQPGMNLVYNGLSTPEPVLSPDQWNAMANRPAEGPTIEIHVSGDGMSPTAVASEVERRLLFALR